MIFLSPLSGIFVVDDFFFARRTRFFAKISKEISSSTGVYFSGLLCDIHGGKSGSTQTQTRNGTVFEYETRCFFLLSFSCMKIQSQRKNCCFSTVKNFFRVPTRSYRSESRVVILPSSPLFFVLIQIAPPHTSAAARYKTSHCFFDSKLHRRRGERRPTNTIIELCC